MGKHEEERKRRKEESDDDEASGSGRSDDDSSSSDEASRGKHKKENSKDKDKKKKKKSKSKHKKHKKHKRSGSDDSDDGGGGAGDLVKQAKKFLKSQLAAQQQQQQAGRPSAGGGAAAAVPGAGVERRLAPTLQESLRITADDYFAKSTEFTAWLQQEKRLFFNELTSEQTHELFLDFVGAWNAGKLAPEMYAGTVAAPSRRTTHVWNIKGAGGAAGGAAAAPRGMTAFLSDQKDQQAASRAMERVEQKKWRAEQKQALEELLPRATGREAQVEKRIARREEAKARDASPDAVRLPGGGDPYGDDDSFAAAKAREARAAQQRSHRNLARAEQVSVAVAQAQQKEDEKMAGFRALLAQGPITIQKRAAP